MKLFEEFESDLRDVNSVKSLAKVMLANGIISVLCADGGIDVAVTELGLIENVPQEKWVIKSNSTYNAIIVANSGLINAECEISGVGAKERFQERTGFEFPEVEE